MGIHELEVSRTVAAPIDKVWRAWTDPNEMKKWYAPETLMTPEVTLDLKVGGSYRVVMKGPEGEHVAVGAFTEVKEPRTLAFTWQWEGSDEETQVTVTLEAVEDGKTKVTLRHSGFADTKGVENHTQGWESTLNKLEQYLA